MWRTVKQFSVTKTSLASRGHVGLRITTLKGGVPGAHAVPAYDSNWI